MPEPRHEHPVHAAVADRALIAIADDGLRAAVATLFAEAQQAINDGRVGLVVLAARRLSCLYEVLVAAGMPPLRGAPVISDRSLDFSVPEPPVGILVLDDSVVVGTTLLRLADRLRDALPGVPLEFRSVLVDVEQRADSLLSELPFAALAERTSEEARDFSRQVVQALFDHQVPFFADFPTTSALLFPRSDWLSYLASPRWLVADVTAPLLGGAGRYALAQVAAEDLRDRVLTRLPPAVAELVDTVKLRSYVHEGPGEDVRVVLVPLAILAPCEASSLDAALDEVDWLLDPALREAAAGWHVEAKQRLVQMVASVCVLAEAWEELGAALPAARPEDVLASAQTELHFGALAGHARHLFVDTWASYTRTPAGTHPLPVQLRVDKPRRSVLLRHPDVQDVLFRAKELIASFGLPQRPDPGELTKVGLVFAHAIASVFGYVDVNYETPQRADIRGLQSRAEYDTYLIRVGGRTLDHGLTLRELTEHLVPETLGGDVWSRSLVSLGVDIGNDLGVIVPVTRYDPQRDVAFRAYRLGETAYLASTPLAAAVEGEANRFDAFASAVRDGYPVGGSTLRVRLAGRPAASPAAEGRTMLARLAANVRAVVPGPLQEWYRGTVIEVHETHFAADLWNPGRRDQRYALMSLEHVADADRLRLRAGATFTWAVYSVQGRPVPRLRFESRVPLDLAERHDPATSASASRPAVPAPPSAPASATTASAATAAPSARDTR